LGRVVGIDPGEARIGIAISDDVRSIAFPRGTVSGRGGWDQAAARVAEALRGEDIEVLVVGLPLRLDGTEGESARRARGLGAALSQAMGIEATYWDERLTTVAAERSLREMGRRGAKRREVVDQSAATILLQGYLDAKTRARWKGPNNQ
jgi:putative Holliday junction resolvase